MLNELLSPDSHKRDRGQARLLTYFARLDAEVALEALLGEVTLTCVDTASLALVLLKSHVIDTGQWTKVSAQKQADAKNYVMRLFVEQPSGKMRGLLTSTVVAMSEAGGDLDSLAGLLAEWMQTHEQSAMACYLLQVTVETMRNKDELQPIAEALIPLLREIVRSGNSKHSLSACRCSVALLTYGVVGDSEAVLKDVLSGMTYCLQHTLFDSKELLETIEALGVFNEKQAPRWGANLTEVCTIMATLIKSNYFEDNIRQSALDSLRILVKRWPEGIKAHQALIGDLFAVALLLISLVETEEFSAAGCEFLQLLCVQLASGTAFAQLRRLLVAGLHTPVFFHQCAALLAIAFSSEGFHTYYEVALGDVLHSVSPFLSSANAYVSASAFRTLEALCGEFEPVIQQNYHFVIVPLLVAGINTEASQVSATKALTGFLKGLLLDEAKSEFLSEYADGISGAVESALKSRSTQGDSIPPLLEALSVFATVLQKRFSPFFPRLLSVLRSLLVANKLTVQSSALRASCINAIGNIVESVSEDEMAGGPAEEMLAYLIYLASILEPDDPSQLAIDDVYAPFAALLKARFNPYLKSVVLRLLSKVRSEESPAEFLNTFSDQCANRAIQSLYSLLLFSDAHFSSMTQATIDALLPHCRMQSNVTLCKFAIKIVAKSLAVYHPTHYREALLRVVLPSLVTNLKTNSNAKYAKWLLKGIRNMMESVELPGVIGLPAATECSSVLAERLSLIVRRRQDLQLIVPISEIVSHLLRGFKLEYQSMFKQYFVTFFEYILQKSSSVVEVRAVVDVFRSFVKYTHDLMIVNSRSLLLEKFIACAQMEDFETADASLAGISQCAKVAKREVFQVYLDQCRKLCESLLDSAPPLCFSAVGTLGVLVLRYLPELKEDWLHLLPLESSASEAKRVHHFFLKYRNDFSSIAALSPHVLTALLPEHLFAEDLILLNSE